MIARVRLLVVLCRPAVLMLLVTYALTALSRAGQEQNPVAVAECLVVVTGFLVFCVALNDLSDAAIDRVNLPADRGRPLVTGAATGREMAALAGVGAVVALGVAVAVGPGALLVTAAGLLIGACYSLRPVRLADRGATAALVLPACYVAVPYLVGTLAVPGAAPTGRDWLMLVGLYAGFTGRILLKDFRDVRGDAMFGKRTFLVRHGRRWTCAFSAVFWTAGAVLVMLTARGVTPAYLAEAGVLLVAALWLLRKLAAERDARREESLVTAIAVIGRGTLLLLFAQQSMAAARLPLVAEAVLSALLVVLALGQARTLVAYGPVTRRTVPAAWSSAEPATTDSAASHTGG